MNEHEHPELHQQTILPLSRRWRAGFERQTTPSLRTTPAGATPLQAAAVRLHERAPMKVQVARAVGHMQGEEGDEGERRDAETPGRAAAHSSVTRAVQRMHATEPQADADLRTNAGHFAGQSHQEHDSARISARTARTHDRPLDRGSSIASYEDADHANTLDARVQGALADMLDLRLPAVRVQTDALADAAARRLAADAIAVHDRILFRSGKFAPHTPAGLALIGHELTHIAADYGQTSPRSGASDNGAGEEAVALRNEARVMQRFTAGPPAARYPVSPLISLAANATGSRVAVGTAPPLHPGPASTPKTALSARLLPGEGAPQPASAPDVSARQLKLIKDEVYRDILDRIRTDFERGA